MRCPLHLLVIISLRMRSGTRKAHFRTSQILFGSTLTCPSTISPLPSSNEHFSFPLPLAVWLDSRSNFHQRNRSFKSGNCTSAARDDIRLRDYNSISKADLEVNDEIRIDRAKIKSGDFSTEVDFNNNNSVAFILEKHRSINSTIDIDLSGFGLGIKGNLSVEGVITITDKSSDNL